MSVSIQNVMRSIVNSCLEKGTNRVRFQFGYMDMERYTAN